MLYLSKSSRQIARTSFFNERFKENCIHLKLDAQSLVKLLKPTFNIHWVTDLVEELITPKVLISFTNRIQITKMSILCNEIPERRRKYVEELKTTVGVGLIVFYFDHRQNSICNCFFQPRGLDLLLHLNIGATRHSNSKNVPWNLYYDTNNPILNNPLNCITEKAAKDVVGSGSVSS